MNIEVNQENVDVEFLGYSDRVPWGAANMFKKNLDQ